MRIVLCIFLFSSFVFAQTKAGPYRARTVNDEVPVREKPDPGSKILGMLPEGKVFDVSSKPVSGTNFYRMRVKPGVVGYVLETDIKPLKAGERIPAAAKADERRRTKKDPRKKRPFELTQFAGFQYATIQFAEDTMGEKRNESLGFFGAKVSGPNLLIEGALPTEMNFLFHYGAPSYYESLTKKSADGWILIADFLLQNYFPQGRNGLFFVGFGPMFRYSKFNATLTDATTGKTTDYSLEDIAIGAAFNLGGAIRINQVALRGELQYYWEKESYLGASIAVQFGF